MHMSRPSRRPVALAATAAAVLLAACGGQASGSQADGAAGAGDAAEDAGAADSAPDELTISHAQGETTVPADPETVVSFDLGALDTLDAMGVDVAGVPEAAQLPERLSAYAGGGAATVVGSLFEPDYEQVNALDPDLIVVGGRSSAVYEELAEIAPTIDVTVDSVDYLDSLAARVTSLAEIFGEQAWAEQELAELDGRVDEVRAAAADAGTGLIVLTTGGELSAYGPGSRFGIIHDELDVAPAVEDVEAATHGDAISFEFVAEADPDHLFVIDRDATIGEEGQAAEALLDNELVAQTTAWRQDQVHYLDGVAWYLLPGGLRAAHDMLDDVADALA